MSDPRRGVLTRSFPLVLILAAVAVTVAGFGHTAPRVLLGPHAPPAILYAHVALAAAWLMILVLQSGLIVSRRAALHRRLGVVFAVVGAVFSFVSFYTAIILRRLDTEGDLTANIAYLSIPLSVWIEFTLTLSLALLWRRDPARHRPLLIINACAAMGPALGRFPEIRHAGLFLAGLMPVIFMAAAMLHDRWRSGRWNVVYAVGIPASLGVAAAAVYLEVVHPPAWVAIVRLMLATF